jgi:hypothetical protein
MNALLDEPADQRRGVGVPLLHEQRPAQLHLPVDRPGIEQDRHPVGRFGRDRVAGGCVPEAQQPVGPAVTAAELDHLRERRQGAGEVLLLHADQPEILPGPPEVRILPHRLEVGRGRLVEAIGLEVDVAQQELVDRGRGVGAEAGDPRDGLVE